MGKFAMFVLLAAVLIPNAAFAEDPPTEIWARTLDLGSDDWGEDIDVDGAGFVYVTGNTYNGTDYDWLTVKYTPDGDTVWARVLDSGNGDDQVQAVAVDNVGGVYVVGWTPDNAIHDWRMLKYDSDGTLLWNKIRDWAPDVDQGCHDVMVDDAGGHLYMTGDYIGSGGTWDYLTVVCDLDGNFLGENGWSGGVGVSNNAWAITLDDSLNVYVSGNVYGATRDWATVKYHSNLTLDWAVTYDSGANDNIPPSTVAVDNTGCVYVVGWAENATTDWQIVKYSPAGAYLWDRVIDNIGTNEGAWGVEVDEAGFIYVNGDYDTGSGWDCRTIKCNSDGVTQWAIDYDGGSNYNDAGRGLAIDDSGRVYVVGHSYNGTTVDFLVIKYQQQTGISEESSVAGYSSASLDVVNNPSRAPVLRFSVPTGVRASLSLYSASGRKISEFSVSSSQSAFTWEPGTLPSGVYFGRLEFGSQSLSAKICLTR